MAELRNRLRWDDVEIFCELAAHGSLRKAAEASGQSLETIRRRINALEVALGERLFRRTAHGLAITATGREILVKAREAQDAIAAITRLSGAERRRERRRLRVSLPEDIGGLFYVPALEAEMDGDALTLDIQLTDPTAKPDWDGTDIGLTYREPERADLRRRRIGRVEFGVYRRSGAGPVEGLNGRTSDPLLLLPPDSHPIFAQAALADLLNSQAVKSAWRINSALALRGLVATTEATGLLPCLAVDADLERVALHDGFEVSGGLDLWLGFHADVGADHSARAFIDRLLALRAPRRSVQARDGMAPVPSAGFHEG